MLPFGSFSVSSLLLTCLINSALPVNVRISTELEHGRAERQRFGIALPINGRFSREQLALRKEKTRWPFNI